MNTFTPQSLKKLLYILAISLGVIVIFLIFKFFFQEQKTIKTHSFRSASKSKSIPALKEVSHEKKFILLPSKEGLK